MYAGDKDRAQVYHTLNKSEGIKFAEHFGLGISLYMKTLKVRSTNSNRATYHSLFAHQLHSSPCYTFHSSLFALPSPLFSLISPLTTHTPLVSST